MARDDLPEGHARLVTRDDGVTTVIQEVSEKVSRRLDEEMAEAFDITVEELERVADYPMPNSSEGLVPAEEFYADSDWLLFWNSDQSPLRKLNRKNRPSESVGAN